MRSLFDRFPRAFALVGALLSGELLCAEVVFYEVLERRTGISPVGIDTVASLVLLTLCLMSVVLSIDIQPSRFCMALRKYSMLISLRQRLPISVVELFWANRCLPLILL